MALVRITFRAEKEAIDRARLWAKSNGTTLQAEFRKWLKDYAEGRWVPQESRPAGDRKNK